MVIQETFIEIPKETKETAIRLLFNTQLLEHQKNLIFDYIDCQMILCNCCIIRGNQDFIFFCQKNGIDPSSLKKKEVIIYKDGTIAYSENFAIKPKKLV